MKILFLTSRLPYPPFRGDKLHLHNILKPLSRRHEVILVSFIQNEDERELLKYLRPLCKRIEVVALPTWRSLLNCAAALPTNTPFQVAYFRSGRMGELFRQVVSEEQPDVIHIHLIRMAQHAVDVAAVTRVLDLTDAMSLYLSRFRSFTSNRIKKILLSEELRRMLHYERILHRFDVSLVSSPVDYAMMQEHLPTAHLRVIPNPVDMTVFPPSDGSIVPDMRRIIFTGNMTYFPNGDAARFLVQEILPRVRREVPDVVTYLVGQNPTPAIRALAGKGVVVTGFVEDLRSEYARSAVAVAPVRFGAGTQYKIIEPLALGVPVVTTSTGAGGVDLIPGEDLLVADRADEFAEHIIRLLREPEWGASMARRAGAKVRRLHDWENVARQLESVYSDAGTGRRQQGGAEVS